MVKMKPISVSPALKWWKKPWIGYKWLFHRKGEASTNHFEAGGFIRSNVNEKYPNIIKQIYRKTELGSLQVSVDDSCC